MRLSRAVTGSGCWSTRTAAGTVLDPSIGSVAGTLEMPTGAVTGLTPTCHPMSPLPGERRAVRRAG